MPLRHGRFTAGSRGISVDYATDALAPASASRCFRVAQTVFGVGLTVEEPNDLSMRMRERLAAAVHAARRQLAIDFPEFALYVWIRPVPGPACRVLERAWAVPLTWRAVCAIGEEAHLPMTRKSSESCPMVSDSTHRSGL